MVFTPVCETKRKTRQESILDHLCLQTPTNLGKKDFWTELNDIGNLVDKAWCIGRDFNEILHPSDKKGKSRSPHSSQHFHD